MVRTNNTIPNVLQEGLNGGAAGLNIYKSTIYIYIYICNYTCLTFSYDKHYRACVKSFVGVVAAGVPAQQLPDESVYILLILQSTAKQIG